MDETQKTELSHIMKNAISIAMDKKDFSVVSLIEYSKQNQLFFDKFYESQFIVKLSQLNFLSSIIFLDYYESYGLNKKQVSTFFSSYAKEALSNFLIETRNQYEKLPAHTLVADKFSLALDKKIFFEQDFFEHDVFKFVENIKLKTLKQKNTANFESYLQSELAPKQDSNHKVKI